MKRHIRTEIKMNFWGFFVNCRVFVMLVGKVLQICDGGLLAQMAFG